MRKAGARYPSDDEHNKRRRKAPAAAAPPARAPRAPSSPAPPELAELAGEDADLDAPPGGTCPRCRAPHADHDRNCASCGSPLRRACPKCKTPTDSGVKFCTDCGTEVPELVAAPEPSALAPLEAAPQESSWEPDDVAIFSAGVNMMLARMNAPLLDDKELSRIDRRTAVMANKYLKQGGRFKDEILWASSWAPPLLQAAYIRYVIAPAREREDAERKAKAQSQTRTGPNLESVK